MDTIQSAESAVVNEVKALGRDFESIPGRLKTIALHFESVIAHPFAPPAMKNATAGLLDVLEDLRQEVAELRVPCPCKPAATSTVVVPAEAAPGAPAADLNAESSEARSSQEAAAVESSDARSPDAPQNAAEQSEFAAWRASQAPGAQAGASARAAQDATNGQA